MIFEHYRDVPIEFDPDRVYMQKIEPYGKPKGLWVSIPGEDDWPSWCRSENFREEHLATRHIVDLDLSRVLVVENSLALEDFDDRFGIEKEHGPNFYHRAISWSDVAAQYSGIVIAPYRWSHRLDGRVSKWYYGWDCSSGCIWDMTAIKSIEVRDGE